MTTAAVLLGVIICLGVTSLASYVLGFGAGYEHSEKLRGDE